MTVRDFINALLGFDPDEKIYLYLDNGEDKPSTVLKIQEVGEDGELPWIYFEKED